MEKSKNYISTFFDSAFIDKAVTSFMEVSGIKDIGDAIKILRVNLKSESWRHDSLEEFLADYNKDPSYFLIELGSSKYSLSISYEPYYKATIVSIKAPTRREIESLFNFYEQSAKDFYIEPDELEKNNKIEENIAPTIFIGHGRSDQWRDLKDHLHEKHSLKVEAYETGARAGHSIRDIIESLLAESSFAILVFTGEDKTTDGTLHARQNVIHEAGLFQGRLGFNNAIILLEEGTEDFSNIHGIQQIRYQKNNIKETFGEVLATIKREFDD